MDQFGTQIDRHLLKQGVDRVVVDTTGLAAGDVARVRAFVDGLNPAARARVIVQGQ
jgi:G3E family GTPase